jgi:hypothetical protein
MLLTVLLYGYCVGVMSSRRIAKACETDLAFRVLSGGELPDFRTLADFRLRHLDTFGVLFEAVLGVCQESGLLQVGQVAIDGSKYQANASLHKAMSYGRIQETEPTLTAEVQELLRRAAELDQQEDQEFGADRRGDELPEELRRREGRLAKIRAAKARLEQRAQERARQQAAAKGLDEEATAQAVAQAVPGPKEQSNFTDPASRIMKTKRGWMQAYNAQIAVDEASGLILAEEVSAQGTDGPRLAAMLDHLAATLTAVGLSASERIPRHLSLDAGYASEGNLALLAERGLDAYVATGRERHHRGGIAHPRPTRTPLRQAMREKLSTREGKAVYARRKAIVEPVHGLIKQARGFRQFLLRSLPKVQGEFTLVALTHNLLKLWRRSLAPAG